MMNQKKKHNNKMFMKIMIIYLKIKLVKRKIDKFVLKTKKIEQLQNNVLIQEQELF